MRGAPRQQVALRILRGVAVAGLSVAAVIAVRDRLPSWAQVAAALSNADLAWLAVAVVAEFVSMAMFARQQRRLLRAFGVPISLPRAGAISWTRSAIAISMPAGSALSAGFAFRQFRASGASRTTAATVMVLSGVISFVALAALYLTGLLASLIGPLTTLSAGSIAVLGLGVSAVVAGAGLVARPAEHAPATHMVEPPVARSPFDGLARRWPRLEALVARTGLGSAVAQLREIRESAREVQRRHWLLALAAGVLNWSADLGCLIAAARAFDLPMSAAQLGLVYLGVQLVRQIPLTPGGVGIIEASLLAGMLAAGSPEAAAAAAVVVYRLLSCWLVIPIGALSWAALRRHPTPAPSRP